MSDLVCMLVGYLGLRSRFARRIAEAGITHPADLADWQQRDLDAVRFLGKIGEAEIKVSLERFLGMSCGRQWTPPPALLRERDQLEAAILADGVEFTAESLGVHPDAVLTWGRLHEHVPEAVGLQERRPGDTARARAILDAGIPVSPRRRQLLMVQVEHPDWTMRQMAWELGWTRAEVTRAMHDHPPEVVAEYICRRGTATPPS